MYIGKKDFKRNFWDTEPYKKLLLQKWKEWQKVWNNRIKHYTPRVDPQHDDVIIDGIIEKLEMKKPKGETQM